MHDVDYGGYAYGFWTMACFWLRPAFFIQWPTIITLFMWSILMFTYYRLSLGEGKELASKFGDKFYEYKKLVPEFISLRNK